MKQALALCAIVAVSSAEPQWLTNWKEYEPAKHQYRHHERVHRRGFAAQDKMKTKMVAAGYPVSAKHAEEMEKHRQRQLKNGHVLQPIWRFWDTHLLVQGTPCSTTTSPSSSLPPPPPLLPFVPFSTVSWVRPWC